MRTVETLNLIEALLMVPTLASNGSLLGQARQKFIYVSEL